MAGAKRLFTLAGVIPAGAFLVEHLVVTASAMGGAERFDRVMGTLARSRLAAVLEVVFVVLPLAFHALYGLHLIARPRDPNHTYGSDLLYRLQRISGVVLLAFIALHLYEVRLQRALYGLAPDGLYTRLVDRFANAPSGIPTFAIVMMFGVVVAAFHLVNGLWAVRAQTERVSGRSFVFFGLILALVGGGTVVSIATGAHFLPEAQPNLEPCGTNAPSPSGAKGP